MPHTWDNYFMLAGAAGASFIGLLFVVVTLGAGWSSAPGRLGVDAFLTPTLVHFCGVLFLAMLVVVPWPSAAPLCYAISLMAIVGFAYQINAIAKKRGQDFVALHWADWIPHAAFPALANVSLLAGAVGLRVGAAYPPYVIAGAVALLLLAGIYGAWDITLWILRNRHR